MAIDSSIYNALRPVQIDDPVNALSKVAQYQNVQQQNRLGQIQVQQAERGMSQENALNDLYTSALKPDGTIDRQVILSGAAQKGLGSKIPGLQKGFADQDKAARDAETAKYDAVTKELAFQGQILGSVKDQASWERARAFAAQRGYDVNQFPAQYDPAFVQQLRQRNLTTAQQYEQEWKKKDFDYKVQNDAANRGVTIRGQNMADSRARDLASATRENGGRPPAGYRWAAGGTLEPIPGGPAEKDKAPTEFQGKSATFGARAEQSDKIISGLEGKYSPAKIGAKQAAGRVGLEGAANFLLPVEEQKAEQAMRDFVNAVLRQESGAAIADSEFNNAKKQYFPQTGDSKEVIAQKAQNRKTAIEGLKKNAGKAAYTATTTLPSGWSVEEQ